MKRLKACLAVATLALCLNGPSLLTRSVLAGNSRSSAPAVSRILVSPQGAAYAEVLGSGRSVETRVLIGVGLAVAAAIIGIATGGAGAIAAGAMGAL